MQNLNQIIRDVKQVPQITIVFSKGLDKSIDMNLIMQICFDEAKQSKLFNMDNVEVRAHEIPYSLNRAGFEAFMHVKLALSSGQDDPKLASLCKAMFEKLLKKLNQSINISVQLAEIDPRFCFYN